MSISTGDKAPQFRLFGSDKQEHALPDESGQVTVLLFYVGDDTPTCSRQLAEYNDAYVELDRLGVRLLGIAPQSQESHYAFTCRLDLRFPLLVDADRSVARQYGAVRLFGMHRRSTFVIDETGIVRYVNRNSLLGYLKATPAADAVEVAKKLVAEGTAHDLG